MSDIQKRIDTIIGRLAYLATHFETLDMDAIQKLDDLSKAVMFGNPPALGVSVDEKINTGDKTG
jgi:hypothetical protein